MQLTSVLAIDPGASKSAYVLWNNKEILDKAIYPNEKMLLVLEAINASAHPVLALEYMQSIHQKSGKAIIDTIFWSGRFYQAWEGQRAKVTRAEVKKALGAKDDPGVRTVLIRRFGKPGTKKNPGAITYGLADHTWSAFAVAVFYMDHLEFQRKIQKA